jgi:hypothetical protein
MMDVGGLRKRVAELRGWRDIVVLPSGEWVGTSPRGIAGKAVPDYTGKAETTDKLSQVMAAAGFWVGVRPPAAPGQPYVLKITRVGLMLVDPPPPGGNYEGPTREIVICMGFVPWAEWHLK